MVLRWAVTALVVGLASVRIAQAGPAVLFEASTGKVLYHEEADQLWHPASLTKIMTAYLTFEALKAGKIKLDQKIPASAIANAQPPSKIGLPVGAELTVDMALRAVIIKSANDASVMLAEAIGGSVEGFVAMMNAKAKSLGMTRTTFVNPHGLPAPEQVSTARDLARLARAVLADHPEYAKLWTLSDMRVGRRILRSHNGLLRSYEGADGIKTGFICDSGYNVIASATRNGRRMVAVVLGEHSARDRNLRAASLLEHGFKSYGWKQLFSSTTIDNLPAGSETTMARSVRQALANWSCNGRRPARVAAARSRKKVAGVRVQRVKAVAQRKAAVSKAALPTKGKKATPPKSRRKASAPTAAATTVAPPEN